jgi:glycosyltransferase involved in cell wall biosynthesis
MPTVKVIMPCFNGERFLEKALDAFFSQDCANKQLIVVDGKSTDGSHTIFEKYTAAGAPMIWDKTPDDGLSHAIKIGLRHLGPNDIYCNLGTDDLLMPGILKEVSFLFSAIPELDGVYYDSYDYVVDARTTSYRKAHTSRFTLENLIKYRGLSPGQNIFLSARLGLADHFSDTTKYAMDFELHLRLLKNGANNFIYVPRPSSINFYHDNISSKFALEQARETIGFAAAEAGWTPRLLWRAFWLYLRAAKRRILARLRP